jgi:predicted RNA-binding Zn-ribbon protein involved in translation (DUF1610 family)
MTDSKYDEKCWNCKKHIEPDDQTPLGICRDCGNLQIQCCICEEKREIGSMMVVFEENYKPCYDIFVLDKDNHKVATNKTKFHCRSCERFPITHCYRCNKWVMCHSDNSYMHPIGLSWRHENCELVTKEEEKMAQNIITITPYVNKLEKP